MIRPSDSIFIIKQDIETGLIKKIEINGLIEYWIYSGSNRARLNQNAELLPEDTVVSESKLDRIIVCDNAKEHVLKDLPNHYVLSGIIYTDDTESDLSEYLTQTGRAQ